MAVTMTFFATPTDAQTTYYAQNVDVQNIITCPNGAGHLVDIDANYQVGYGVIWATYRPAGFTWTWEATTNVHMFAVATTCIRAAMLRTYPAPFLILSYFLVWGLYVMLVMMCLFVTSAMTQAEAEEWLERCAIIVCLKVFFVQPCIAILKVCLEELSLDVPISDMDLGFD